MTVLTSRAESFWIHIMENYINLGKSRHTCVMRGCKVPLNIRNCLGLVCKTDLSPSTGRMCWDFFDPHWLPAQTGEHCKKSEIMTLGKLLAFLGGFLLWAALFPGNSFRMELDSAATIDAVFQWSAEIRQSCLWRLIFFFFFRLQVHVKTGHAIITSRPETTFISKELFNSLIIISHHNFKKICFIFVTYSNL